MNIKKTYLVGSYSAGLIVGLVFLNIEKPGGTSLDTVNRQTAGVVKTNSTESLAKKTEPILHRYATIDEVMQAIGLALTNPTDELCKLALKRVASAIEWGLLPELQPRLEKHVHRLVQNEMTEYMLRLWAQHDLKAAMDYVQSRPVSWRRQTNLEIVASEWAKIDEDGAVAWFVNLPPSEYASRLMQCMLAAIAEKSPEKALRMAGNASSQKLEHQQAVLEIWAEKDPAAASAALAALPNKSPEMISRIAASWALMDPEPAMAWIKQMPGTNPLGKYTGRFLNALLLANKSMAAEFALNLPEGEPRNEAVRQIASTLCKEGLEEAVAWVNELPQGLARKQAQQELLFAQVESDPKSALDQAASYPEGAARNDLIDQLASKWTARDPKAATAWASQIKDDTVRTSIYISAVNNWMQTSPDEAGAFVKNMPEGMSRNICQSIVLEQLAQNNPQAAVEWASESGGTLEAQGAATIAKSWAAIDPTAAANWINQMEKGSVRDESSFNYALSVARLYDAANAMPWAETIDNEARRLAAIQNIAVQWKQQNETAMIAWLKEANLPQEYKNKILHP